MKEIGEKLREARENMGISLEEAAEDLKLRPKQIENIENGKMEAFIDIFYLKYFIRDYAKYLGLSFEDVVDEFNEYLFDYTSKISVEDIKNAKKNMANTKEAKKIASPYTLEPPKKINIPIYVIVVVAVIVLSTICYFIFRDTKEDEFREGQVAMNLKGGNYEFTE